MILALLLAADLCAGRIQDKIDHPMLPAVLDPATLAPIQGKPSVGVPFLDPSFGTVIARIVAAPVSEGDNAVVKTLYSTVPAWNADESLLMLWHREKGHEFYQGDAPYKYLGNLALSPTDIEHVIWDRTDPLVLYYPTTRYQGGRNLLMKVAISPTGGKTESVHFDFSGPPTNCPITAPGNRFGLGANPEVSLGPRSIIGLVCGTEGERKIIFSITEKKVLAYGTAVVGPLAPIIDPTEKQVLLGEGWVFDIAFKYLRRLTAAFYFEHSQVGQDSRGGVWNTAAFDQSAPGVSDAGQLVSHALADGTRKVIIGPATGYPYIPSLTHISATGPAGWVALGSVGSRTGSVGPGDGELMLANTDTGQVCRVGHTRTWAGSCTVAEGCYWGYWGESHPVLSPSGTRIVFSSDGRGFGGVESGSVDTYVVDLRKPHIRVRVKSNCEVVSFSPVQSRDCKVESYEVVP